MPQREFCHRRRPLAVAVSLLLSLVLLVLGSKCRAESAVQSDLRTWQVSPEDFRPVSVMQDDVRLQNASKWNWLTAPQSVSDFEFHGKITVQSPATQFQFFGQSWSVWPDRTFGDQGFEAAVLLRAGRDPERGYRVQFSHYLQQVALVRYPDGGYVRSVSCPIESGKPLDVRIRAHGRSITVVVDGQDRIHFLDSLSVPSPPDSGQLGIGVSSNASVSFSNITVDAIADPMPQHGTPSDADRHVPQFAARKWLGHRLWVFDGDEPICLLPDAESSYINNVKLRPGSRPQLSWNSHWDTQNQGAYKEAENHTTDVAVSGKGESLTITWRGRHVADRFGTATTMRVGFDPQRRVYTYDIDSTLTVGSEPFHFRYGYDFEHHTPLDPFNWQYLIARRRDGSLYHRPVYPIDPGPQTDLEPYHGLRVWYGRHSSDFHIAPAVEYQIEPAWNQVPTSDGAARPRVLNTAVCAAFYDTGVSFGAETAAPGTQVRVKYRYTGYPAQEAESLFQQSDVYDSRTLDPTHNYIFADEWPCLTFQQTVPLSQTWQYGRTPFLSGHNVRPTYRLVRNCGAASGNAMQLGPASLASANWPMPHPLPTGKYALHALVKLDNIHGDGGRIELTLHYADRGSEPATFQHFCGTGSRDWHRAGFVLDVPSPVEKVTLAFGNSGTGSMQITDVQLPAVSKDSSVPDGIHSGPQPAAAYRQDVPAGAVADYRMGEGAGFHVLNHAGDDHLQLANVSFSSEFGRPALLFTEDPDRTPAFDPDSILAVNYLDHPAYAERQSVPVAIAGHHGGGTVLPGLTLCAWIRPAAEMGHSHHRGKGDIIGYGARRFVLGLHGQTAPYRLAARLNVNDIMESDTALEADRWYHVAMTCAPVDGQWQVDLFLDGRPVATGRTTKLPADSVVPHSIVLGSEIFYLHDAWYRGRIGRTLVFHEALRPDRITQLASE